MAGAATYSNSTDISLYEFDEKSIVFGTIQDGKYGEFPYYRIPIFRYNGTRQVPLIIRTQSPDDDTPDTWLYSPGLKAFTDKEKKDKITHSMMVLLHSKEGAKPLSS